MKLEKSKYQGYLWYSDKKEPLVLNDEVFELEIADSANPFIIEGQLFDGDKSISIKFVDGKHLVKEYKLADLQSVEYREQTFVGHRMKKKEEKDDKSRNLVFRQYWRTQPDELCEGMQVLQPAEMVFVGFKSKEE